MRLLSRLDPEEKHYIGYQRSSMFCSDKASATLAFCVLHVDAAYCCTAHFAMRCTPVVHNLKHLCSTCYLPRIDC